MSAIDLGRETSPSRAASMIRSVLSLFGPPLSFQVTIKTNRLAVSCPLHGRLFVAFFFGTFSAFRRSDDISSRLLAHEVRVSYPPITPA